MSEAAYDPRTPGRRAGATSTLAQHDLSRRLARLPVPTELLPRLTRVVAEEVEAALAARAADAWSADEIVAAGGDPALVARLREAREEARRVAAIRQAGLERLSPQALAEVLEAARQGRS